MWLGQNPLSNVENIIVSQNVFEVESGNAGIVINGNNCIITDNISSDETNVTVSGGTLVVENNIGISNN